jgi:CheY-like chemotaxis protein
MSAKRVLIAEDSSVIQNLARKILEFQNYDITSVKNGEQVMQILDKEQRKTTYSALNSQHNLNSYIKQKSPYTGAFLLN